MSEALLLFLCLYSVCTFHEGKLHALENRDQSTQLQVGMTMDEVEKIIGEKSSGITILGAATFLDFHKAKLSALFTRGKLVDIIPYVGTTSRYTLRTP